MWSIVELSLHCWIYGDIPGPVQLVCRPKIQHAEMAMLKNKLTGLANNFSGIVALNMYRVLGWTEWTYVMLFACTIWLLTSSWTVFFFFFFFSYILEGILNLRHVILSSQISRSVQREAIPECYKEEISNRLTGTEKIHQLIEIEE